VLQDTEYIIHPLYVSLSRDSLGAKVEATSSTEASSWVSNFLRRALNAKLLTSRAAVETCSRSVGQGAFCGAYGSRQRSVSDIEWARSLTSYTALSPKGQYGV
jgi:hypothetical protein